MLYLQAPIDPFPDAIVLIQEASVGANDVLQEDASLSGHGASPRTVYLVTRKDSEVQSHRGVSIGSHHGQGLEAE